MCEEFNNKENQNTENWTYDNDEKNPKPCPKAQCIKKAPKNNKN